MCVPTYSRRGLIRAGAGVVAAASIGVPLADALAGRALAATGGGATTSVFRAVRPTRVVDSRFRGPWSYVAPGRLRVQLAGQHDVPSDAVAVVATVTREGSEAPARSVDVVASVRGALTTFVPLVDGGFEVAHSGWGVVTVDVLGVFVPSGAASAGRVLVSDAVRVLDTEVSADPFSAREQRSVTVGDAVPADASAVLVELTTTPSTADGSWTAFPSGVSVPPSIRSLIASSESATSAFTIVPLTDRSIGLTSSAGGHVAVDVVGHVTGDRSSVSTVGLFVPEPARRVLDTRFVDQPVPAGSSREVVVGPDRCSAVVATVALVGAPPSRAAVWPAGAVASERVAVSGRGRRATAARFVVTGAGARGLAVGVDGGEAHLVVDSGGWFTGERSPATVAVRGAQPFGIQEVLIESLADEWFDYGVSTEGRPLRAFRFGSGRRHALISSGIHGDELTGTSVIADLVTRARIDGWTLWLVPVANPDARAINRRFVHDVDMNRDFPVDWAARPSPTASGCITTRTGSGPYTLPESRHLARAIVDGAFRRCEVSISHHDNYNWVAPQAGSSDDLRRLADDYAVATGLRLPGQGGSVVPTSPRRTNVPGGFETFADSRGMASFLVENKAGWIGGAHCAGSFGVEPVVADVTPHADALRSLLTDGRL